MPDSDDNSYDKQSLLCLGYLWCAGEVGDKADVLAKLINDPDSQAGDNISATDRDLEAVFGRLFKIATEFTLKAAIKSKDP